MRNKRFLFIALVAGILLGLASCQDENLNGEQWFDGNTGIAFGASIEEERPVGTRAEATGTPGLDSVYVAHDPWDQDFFIELNTEKDGSPFTAYGVYNVPSGYEGRLEPVDPERALNWENLDKNHFNIGGLCGDIYFSDENGNNTIYIDNDGYIWITDENGRFILTENRLPDEMPDGIRGFDISCRSGKIRPTTYFNDRLGS